MKTLKDIKDEFESSTVGGHEVRFLAYHPDSAHPIIVEVFQNSKWKMGYYKDTGFFFEGKHETPLNLVRKNKSLPKDILCEVWGDGNREVAYSNGRGSFFNKQLSSRGAAILEHTIDATWSNHKIVENDPKPWTGGTCPIPDNCKYRVFVFGEWLAPTTTDKTTHNWEYLKESLTNITAYQILGE